MLCVGFGPWNCVFCCNFGLFLVVFSAVFCGGLTSVGRQRKSRWVSDRMACSRGYRCSWQSVWAWTVCFLLALQVASGNQFKVGGGNGWAVPSGAEGQTFNQWAESRRFRVGDTLLFEYLANKDSVLQVTSEGYQNCNRSSPIASFSDGNTVFKFPRSGPYYFISGVPGHCENGQKLVVVVMSEGGRRGSARSPAGAPIVAPPSLSPATSPAGEEGPASSPSMSPAVAPTSDAAAQGVPLVAGLLSVVGFFMVL